MIPLILYQTIVNFSRLSRVHFCFKLHLKRHSNQWETAPQKPPPPRARCRPHLILLWIFPSLPSQGDPQRRWFAPLFRLCILRVLLGD